MIIINRIQSIGILVISWEFKEAGRKASVGEYPLVRGWLVKFNTDPSSSPKGGCILLNKEDGCRLEPPLPWDLSAASRTGPILLGFFNMGNKPASPWYFCMTYTGKLHRSSCSVTILKQQWQVSPGALKMNRNTPGTAYSSVFSLAHRSLKPVAGTKGSTAVPAIRTHCYKWWGSCHHYKLLPLKLPFHILHILVQMMSSSPAAHKQHKRPVAVTHSSTHRPTVYSETSLQLVHTSSR